MCVLQRSLICKLSKWEWLCPWVAGPWRMTFQYWCSGCGATPLMVLYVWSRYIYRYKYIVWSRSISCCLLPHEPTAACAGDIWARSSGGARRTQHEVCRWSWCIWCWSLSWQVHAQYLLRQKIRRNDTNATNLTFKHRRFCNCNTCKGTTKMKAWFLATEL